jgi:hypothetical protein
MGILRFDSLAISGRGEADAARLAEMKSSAPPAPSSAD